MNSTDMETEQASLKEQIWQIIASIPKGCVATYGQIARISGHPGHSRYVGTTLKNLPHDTKIPWFRVINAKGELSFTSDTEAYARQREKLESEGLVFKNNKLSLKVYQWKL